MTDIYQPQTIHVDPARLADGEWDPAAEKYVGEGDIASSYSADRISEGKPIRMPFAWQGSLWVCVSCAFRGGAAFLQAYRLLRIEQFPERAMPYAEKTMESDAARSDPKGFYHGIQVKHRGETWALSGPGVTFASGEPAQMNLFCEPS